MNVVTRTLVCDDLTPVRAYAALRQATSGPVFLLESVVGGERWGRYSFLGYRPQRHVVVASGPTAPAQLQALLSPPVELIHEAGLAARFARSLVGIFFYDLVHDLVPVPSWPDEPSFAARLLGEPTVVVFDHLAQTVQLAAPSLEHLDAVEHDLNHAAPLPRLVVPSSTALPTDVEVSLSDDEFKKRVLQAKEYIAAGDIFQVQIARTFSVPRHGRDALSLYRALRILSPSPYMYLLDFPEADGAPAVAVAGASPETLVRREGTKITLRPIAGTRRRGRSDDEDHALAREMAADPKELAEHVMLIDLARNDMGRIAQFGSVAVTKQFDVERFSHVMHLVSDVEGTLRPGLSSWDILQATFPAGTLTGAPKVRAMQILRELEKARRGVYGGGIGYVTPGGDFDLAIAIRTLVLHPERIEVTAAAGVVEGSEPALEALETRNKARAGLCSCAAVPPRAVSK